MLIMWQKTKRSSIPLTKSSLRIKTEDSKDKTYPPIEVSRLSHFEKRQYCRFTAVCLKDGTFARRGMCDPGERTGGA